MGAHTEAFRYADDASSCSSDIEDAEREAPTSSVTAEGSANGNDSC